MAMQKVCDRCGKTIGTGIFPRPLIRKGLIDRSYDLCYDCYAEFDEWMEGKKEQEVVSVEKDNNPPGDLLGVKPGPNHTGRIRPNCCEVKVVKGNTYEPKTENEENETGAGVV